jgi:basic amino acid/polyamine antiporter, APA family
LWHQSALLVYYLFVGLHASYDTTKALATESAAAKVEDGDDNKPIHGAAHNGE